MFLTTSDLPTESLKNNEEWTLHRGRSKDLDKLQNFKDVKIVSWWDEKLKEWIVFHRQEHIDAEKRVGQIENGVKAQQARRKIPLS